MKILLNGFMGAGKTTAGELLAARLGLPFIDLDSQVEATTGLTIEEIFEERGEGEFRRLEADALEAALGGGDAVIALGGGALIDRATLARVRRRGITIWLDAGFEVSRRRLQSAGMSGRPLFVDPVAARELYRRRLSAYRRCDLRIEVTETDSPVEVVDRIVERLREAPCDIS